MIQCMFFATFFIHFNLGNVPFIECIISCLLDKDFDNLFNFVYSIFKVGVNNAK